MNISHLSRIACCVIASLGAAWVNSAPQLNGVAAHIELSKERFIAALYSDTLSDDSNRLLTANVPQRMELKVTDRRLTARSLNSMWIEGMAINNSSQELEAHAEDLAKLTNMVRKSLVPGDVLQIDSIPGEGTTVSVNGVALGTINSDSFFPLLLRTWIGRVPLSSDFKTGLLSNGKVDSGLLARYEGLQPDEARIAAVTEWANQAPPSASSRNDDSTSVALAPPPPTITLAPPPPRDITPPSASSSSSSNSNATASNTPRANTTGNVNGNATRAGQLAEPAVRAIREQNPETVAASLPKPKPAADATPKADEPKPAAEEAPKPTQVARATPPPAPKPAAEDDEDDEEIEVFSASSLLQRQYFISSSLAAIQREVTYPRRAMERDQQGTVRLAVTINRLGEIQNVQVVDEPRYNTLTKAAIKAVEDTAPFAELPKSLTGDSFTFTVPITFAIKG